jgi:hypothetical protein
MMPAPLPSTSRNWRRLGFIALGIGLALIALMLFATIFVYR